MFKKVKLWSFFAEDMFLSIENPKDSTRELLKVINEFSVNLQAVKSTPRNQWCFHMLKTKYRGGKKTTTTTKKTISFTTSPKTMKYSEINLIKKIKPLQSFGEGEDTFKCI